MFEHLKIYTEFESFIFEIMAIRDFDVRDLF